ncbi:uncharacterized protein MYCFIDRAFT_209859 [Pseudocercospora fijiensis CIRAD86]|uniref:Uncharacterized protein n=1 Tax=Pseudocercospora fijiensis (strain CIRAD86) TaxID=383855 RepID=N1QBP7_PSEFD|nr:uncharacterized protein MYCFIDRAFT_209859 [Pseudocercospora fijiensis CIRAD86]EME88623.1 hypothetical protein MYCFIDRAFT_209859 [Pseudocercospora fijiensis CIRAD86]
MCVAGLNVSTQPCAHRWYELIRPCNPANNLQNCPERVKLEGWEKRNDRCPFCDGSNHHRSTHRLFGSTSSASSVVSSPTIPDMGFISLAGRRESGATLNGTLSPLSTTSSIDEMDAVELERATRARDMNDRLHVYLSCDPHEVLPSAKKNYPTYATAIQRAEEAAANSSDGPSSRKSSLIRRQSLTRGWKRMSHRFSFSSFSDLRIFERQDS